MPVSEEDLLAALKKSKDKLDLELITKEEYDIIKEEVVKKLQNLN